MDHKPEAGIPGTPPGTPPGDHDSRAYAFALAVGDGTRAPSGPTLDDGASTSPLADALRSNGIDESKFANVLLRCLDSDVGRNHVEYLKLTRECLGYRPVKPESGNQNQGSGADDLARSVAAALDQARVNRIHETEIAKKENGSTPDGIGPGTLGAEVLGQ